VVISDGQYFGDALNIAARIQALARPGGISVSGAVYRALDEPELRFAPTGRHDLKNIPGPVQIYEFSDLPAMGTAQRSATERLAPPPTVAALPIHLEDVDSAVVSTARLIAADLVHRLTSVPGLHVVDATEESRREAAQPLVQYMLETGVHQAGDVIRVYVKLIDIGTINVVFSHRRTATPETLLEVFDAIGDDVTNSLEIELIIGEPARLFAELQDANARQHIYRGWARLTSLTEEGWRDAIDHFGSVERGHPDEAVSHALLAFGHWAGAFELLAPDPEAEYRRALDHARRGDELGDPTGLSQMVEAAILLSRGRAEDAMRKLEAVEITRPTCDVTFALEGSTRRVLGQWERAIELLNRAMRLTPVDKPWYSTVRACSLYIGGRYEDAAATAAAVLAGQPDNIEALLVLAVAQHRLGLDRRAAATAHRIRDRHPAGDVEDWLATRPYQDPDLIAQWRRDLEAVGIVEPS
jgi:adenylate cyclase